MSDLVKAGTQALEAYIAAGDIERLDPSQRIALYRSVCASLGLNELTQPFQYLRLSGKTVLYATKSCTEQLRQIHGVSVIRMEKELFGEILVVTVAVKDKNGREDIATGSVCLKGLGGEMLSNAYMKAETKAKRRATLSICGLAVLDESETESIAGAERRTVQDLHDAPAPAAAPAPAPAPQLPEAASKEEKPRRRKGKPAEETAPQPAEEKAADRPEGEPILEVVDGDARISVVVNGAGRKIWRVDREGEAPLAIVDEKLAGMLEAILAFGGSAEVAIMERSGKRIVQAVEDARDE